jgi:DUF1365 family protein
MNAAVVQPALAQIGVGVVRHRRLRPALHSFQYPTYFLMLPMRSLRTTPCPALRRNRLGWLSFHDRDHGDGGPDALAWLDTLLAAHLPPRAGLHLQASQFLVLPPARRPFACGAGRSEQHLW